jgi:hypothetical protein
MADKGGNEAMTEGEVQIRAANVAKSPSNPRFMM